jgi:hypothetical protein
MLGLDVQNTRENTNIDMTMFWFVIIMSLLFYICTFLPMGLFYAESDEGKSFVSSINAYCFRDSDSVLHLNVK